ncbi:MAG: hypothetical protein Q4G03_06465 [Planctomycetia bacterium]|nr:hypothetical protein [Planctomycetia bacterium]
MKQTRRSLLWLVLIIAVVTFVSNRGEQTQTQAQMPSGPEVDALRESIGNFFENLSDPNKGASKAINEFLKNSALNESEDVKKRIVDGLQMIDKNFGAYVSYEPIGQKAVGEDLVVFRYLYKRQNYPIVWYFTYYRPRAKTVDATSTPTSWTLIGFRYDANLDVALLDSSFDKSN